MDYLLVEAADYFNLSKDAIKSKTRQGPLVWARQVIMAMGYKYTPLSYAECAAYFGKNHATCIHAMYKVRDMKDTNDIKYCADVIYFEGKCEVLIDALRETEDPKEKALTMDFTRAVNARRDRIIKELKEIIDHDRVMEGYARYKFQTLLTNLEMCIKVV